MSTNAPLAIALAIVVTVSASAQSPFTVPTGAGSRVVSPAVVATSITQVGPSEKAALDLLVLWRGTPGWFLGGRRKGSATWGGGDAAGRSESARAGRSQGVVVHQLSFGDYSLTLRFDRETRSLQVQGTELMLQDSNVVLVDGVDAPAGPTVIGMTRIDGEVEGFPVRIEPLLRASPELLAFLRCDTALPDPAMQKVVEAIVCSAPGR